MLKKISGVEILIGVIILGVVILHVSAVRAQSNSETTEKK